MILLLVVSTAGYSLMSADKDSGNIVEEKGFEFVRDAGMWKLIFSGARAGAPSEEGKIFAFQYLPSQLEDIDVNVSIEFGDYAGNALYFVKANEGTGEILNNLGGYILRYQEACLGNETTCEGNLPLKDCDSNLIIFNSGNTTKVYGDENCVFIEGDSIKGVDAFLYDILGI